LLKTGSASKTSALFFLVPPVSIFMAWLLLGEQVTRMDLLGLLIATVGVYLATRK
jgi:drug/metabolite transporter (DMT)-like permease